MNFFKSCFDFSNPGGKIKFVAKTMYAILVVFPLVLAFIAYLYAIVPIVQYAGYAPSLLCMFFCWLLFAPLFLFLVFLAAVASTWLPCILLYGFGELIENTDYERIARRKSEERLQREAEEKAKREAEEKAKYEAEERAKREAEKQARLEAKEKARREAEEKARLEAEEVYYEPALKVDEKYAEEKAKREDERQARLDAEASAKLKAEGEAEAYNTEQKRSRMKTYWDNIKLKQKYRNGRCEMCSSHDQVLVTTEIEDFFGKTTRAVCFDCFCRYYKEPQNKTLAKKPESDHENKTTPLAQMLSYALKFTTDFAMISYLKKIDNEKVNAILTLPEDEIRAAVESLLNEENNK